MFVRNGKMDWDGVIVAEEIRRKFLEMYPESATNEEPMMFRSSIIPWWDWLSKTYLPEAELLKGWALFLYYFHYSFFKLSICIGIHSEKKFLFVSVDVVEPNYCLASKLYDYAKRYDGLTKSHPDHLECAKGFMAVDLLSLHGTLG